jgi:hypothetical protein
LHLNLTPRFAKEAVTPFRQRNDLSSVRITFAAR